MKKLLFISFLGLLFSNCNQQEGSRRQVIYGEVGNEKVSNKEDSLNKSILDDFKSSNEGNSMGNSLSATNGEVDLTGKGSEMISEEIFFDKNKLKPYEKILSDSKKTDTSSKKKIATSNLIKYEEGKIEKIKKYQNGIAIKWFIDEEGNTLKDGEMAIIEYRLALPDGKIIGGNKPGSPYYPFDPFVVGYNMQTSGWDFAFKQLSTGDFVKIELPASFAYGQKGIKDLIPKNSILWLFVKVYARIEPAYEKNGIKSWYLGGVKDESKPKKENTEYILQMTLSTQRKANIINTYFYNTPIKYKPGQKTILPGLRDIVESSSKGDRYLVLLPPEHAFGKDGFRTDVKPTDKVLVNIEVEDIRVN